MEEAELSHTRMPAAARARNNGAGLNVNCKRSPRGDSKRISFRFKYLPPTEDASGEFSAGKRLVVPKKKGIKHRPERSRKQISYWWDLICGQEMGRKIKNTLKILIVIRPTDFFPI